MFNQIADLGQSLSLGVGRPTKLSRDEKRDLVAVAGEFGLLYWPARATYDGHRLRHRVSVFRRGESRPVAVFDGAAFPINDLAFHPSEPIIAVATGAYDGGYAFEGELLLWNWETGIVRRPLGASREVVRCRFLDAARLALLLRPPTDEDEPAATLFSYVLDDFRDARQQGLSNDDPRLANLHRADPAAFGVESNTKAVDDDGEIREALSFDRYESRHRVWDVGWMGPAMLGVVHDGCLLELWSDAGERVQRFRPADEADDHGVQILRAKEGVFVHCFDPRLRNGSSLFALHGEELRLLRRLDQVYSLSVNQGGRLLARSCRPANGPDLVLNERGETIAELQLGHYDCFNHYLRLDGSNRFYFLRGTPPGSHLGKRVCVVAEGNVISEVGPWDPVEGGHFMEGCGCLVAPDTLVRGFRVYRPTGPSQAFVESVSLSSMRSTWRVSVAFAPVALRYVRHSDCIVFATLDGRLGALDAKTGELLEDLSLARGNAATFVMSLDSHGDRLAAGTIDGRVLVYRMAR